jgi:ABC-2 type transport system permease protein
MFALIKKELGHYFNNPFGYITVILFGVFANFLFVKDIFVVGTVSMRGFFESLPWLAMIFVPAVAMRALSEEKRGNTLEILHTLPITEVQIVAAKFVAVVVVTSVGLCLTFGLPISLNAVGAGAGSQLHLPEVFVAYVGAIAYFKMAGAISLFFSGMTKNQVVAFLSAVLVLFFANVIGTEFVATALPKFAQDLFSILSPINQLGYFYRGLLDLRAVFYFASVTAVFLLMTVIDLRKRE